VTALRVVWETFSGRQERSLSNPRLTLFPSEALDQYSDFGISSYRLPQAAAFLLPSFRYIHP